MRLGIIQKLRLLATGTIESQANGDGRIVEPLFPVVVIENLPGDPLGRTQELAHLLGRHAAFELGEGARGILSVLVRRPGLGDKVTR